MVLLSEEGQKEKKKTFAVRLPTYHKVLKRKGEFEMEFGRVVYFDEAIDYLADGRLPNLEE